MNTLPKKKLERHYSESFKSYESNFIQKRFPQFSLRFPNQQQNHNSFISHCYVVWETLSE